MAGGPSIAHGQTTYPSPYTSVPPPFAVQPLSDADQLSSEIRLLAADPKNLQALVRAGELALKLDDDTAAAAFFARAERIDPRNARVKAGEGSLLVAAERPGDALRHFAEAEALGGDVRGFAADRGLAYDLVGEQDRAQRDYRLALRGGANDETQRRYALSLGISGKRELALTQIEPLLRKSDRGAWRTRAFILAMGGDKAGAEKIATSMMPAGMAQGLQPFFEMLPTLRPADRAFAVHFGEVRATSERIADARMVPPLAALGPDPSAPVVVAVVPKPVVVADVREQRRQAKRSRRDRGALAPATAVAAAQPLPAPPAYGGQPVELAANTARLPSIAVAPATLAPTTVVRPPVAAATVVRPALAPTIATPPRQVAALPLAQATERRPLVVAPASITAAPVTTRPEPSIVVSKPLVVASSVPTAALSAPMQVAAAATSASPSGTSVVPAASGPVSTEPPATVALVTQPTVSPTPASLEAAPQPVVATVVPRPAPTPVRSEESLLAAIIADIKVPGSELEAAPDPEPTPAPVPAPRRAIVTKPVAVPEPAPVDTTVADKKAADKKLAADRKVAADKKAAAEKKLADAKKAAEEKKKKNDPKLLEPSRIWVQVAGGANERDLPKQWVKVRAKSKAFGSKGGWTTPLRATNRILTGPFKSDDEAQSFVNTVAKDGISAFVFVSDAGQKITRLAAK